MIQVTVIRSGQPAVPAAPPAPQAGVATQNGAIPGVTIVTPRVLTAQDIAALRARRSELSDQLSSASQRRRSTRDALRTATGADKAGLEQHLGVLDARIARLESDIDETGQQLASLEATRVGTTGSPGARVIFPPARGLNMTPVAIIFTIFVLCPLAVSLSRLFWRRGNVQRASLASVADSQRMERLEQAVDSIAIEVERISEGQRFVTRLMSEGRAQAPVAVGNGAESVPVRSQQLG